MNKEKNELTDEELGITPDDYSIPGKGLGVEQPSPTNDSGLSDYWVVRERERKFREDARQYLDQIERQQKKKN